MTYDRDSFLAGLAVGRAMWQPPSLIGEVTPGILWTADPEYLVYDADMWLCTMSNDFYNRDFYKTNNGIALGVFGAGLHNQYSYPPPSDLWYGPILISTDPEYTYYSDSLGVVGSVVYQGAVFYYNNGYHIANNGEVHYTTDLVVYGPDDGPTNADNILRIMQAANVRVIAVGE